MENIPKHIAFIMDGNRRWAVENGLPKIIGHTEGAKTMKRIVKKAVDLGIGYVTFWALSTDNVKERTKEELEHLYSLFVKLVDYLGEIKENNVQVRVFGSLLELPEKVQQALGTVIEETKNNTKLVLTLAVNYGGRDEILRSIQRFLKTNPNLDAPISEEDFTKCLDTAELPDPELIIRTGGAKRLSGFLPWQSIYSEIYFSETYWPAFTDREFGDIIEWYKGVQRNFGK